VEMPNGEIASSSSLSMGGIVLAKAPLRQTVQTGLSNDTQTEIISGLKEGDTIIVRTNTASTASSQASQGQSLFQQGGARITTGGGFNR
ncbi:MAG: hypothetical protein PHE77_02195, partial [Candidatus Pacebacteria bacterium]|nr:hypothetical protein [Candidatus Paceibacterota bacterium]